MHDLRVMAEEMGLDGAETMLQSGNLLFAAPAKVSNESLERKLESETKNRFGLETGIVVRSAPDWRAMVEANPFRAEARRDPARLHAWILKRPPPAEAAGALRSAYRGPERFAVSGATAYIFYTDGAGRSRLTAAVLDRHLGAGGTGRNWNTVLKVLETLNPGGGS